MPKLSNTLKKVLRLYKNKDTYIEVDYLLNKKEKQQITLFLSILFIPCSIGLALFLLN